MKVKLLDWLGNPTWVDIPEDVDHIEGKIICDDMVMTYPFYMDSSNERINDLYLDGEFYLGKEGFKKWNEEIDTVDDIGLAGGSVERIEKSESELLGEAVFSLFSQMFPTVF